MRTRFALRFVAAIVIAAFGFVAMPATRVTAGSPDIFDRIRDAAGVVSVFEENSNIPGTRFFQLEFEQPVDHEVPTGPRFHQRVTILHRDVNVPTVLEINGYYVIPGSVQYELTALLQANQIHVEHRYFIPSRPDPVDWPLLSIAQSASDHHAIVMAFRPIYTARWVSSGASKGGMASVYHRFFYPDDVDATVPYVAPSSHGTQDTRYVAFVAGLGPEKCQNRLVKFQRRALKKRAKLVRFMGDLSFDILGKDRAIEFAILEMPFIFWQYNNAELCSEIPGADASARQIYNFLDRVVFVNGYSDDALTYFEAYYYQSATELGGPAVGEAGLEDLLRYPGQDGPEVVPPLGVEKPFDPAVMPMIERFVLEDARRVLFIYGENDPWSTNAFAVGADNDSYRLFVTGREGNHNSGIEDLSDADRNFALGKLSEWLNVPAARASAADLAVNPSYRIDRRSRRELFLR
jgi:hypothetical protein